MPRNITVSFEDGTNHIYQNAPDDVTPDLIEARALKDFSKRVTNIDGGRGAPQPTFKPIPDEPGFFKAYGTGLASTLGSLIPAAKLMGSPEDQAAAEALRKNQQDAEEAYRRTEFGEIGKLAKSGDIGGALGATWSKFKELAGESLAFQTPAAAVGLGARVAAGALAGSAAGPAGAGAGALWGLGAYGVTLLGQYIASNLSRQVEENKGKPVNRLDATVAAAGQSALDLAGVKFFGLNKLLGLEGRAAAEQTIDQLVKTAQKQGIAKTAGVGALRGTAFEVPQEVAQSVLERWQAGLETNPFKDPKAAEEYAEAAAGALLLGAPLGGASRIATRAKERGEALEELERRSKAEEAALAPQIERDRILAERQARAESRAVPEQPVLYGTPEGDIVKTPEELAAREAFAQRQFEQENRKRQQPELFRDQTFENQQRLQALGQEISALQQKLAAVEATPAKSAETQKEKDAAIRQLRNAISSYEQEFEQRKLQSPTSQTQPDTVPRPQFELTSEPQQQIPQQGELPFGYEPPRAGRTPTQRDLFAPFKLQIDDDVLTDLGFRRTSKRARDMLRGLDLNTRDGIETFRQHIDQLSGKVKFSESAAQALLEQAEYRLAQERQALRPTGAPITIGQPAESETTTGQLTPEQRAVFDELKGVGPGLEGQHILDRWFQDEAAKEGRVWVPEQRETQVGGLPLLRPTSVPTPKVAPAQEPGENPVFVTEQALDNMGIPPEGRNKATDALRQQLLAKDLRDENDRNDVRTALVVYRDRATTPEKTKANIDSFLFANLPQQTNLGFAEGAPNATGPTTGGSSMGMSVPRQPAGGPSVTGTETGGLAVPEGTTTATTARESQPAGALSENRQGITIEKRGEKPQRQPPPSELPLQGKPVGAQLNKEASAAVEAGDLRGALKNISENGSTSFAKFIAKRLLGHVGNIKLRVADIPTLGEYDPNTDTITINPRALYEHTLLHEMVHAAVSHVLRNKFNLTTRAMQALFDQVRPRIAGEYGAASLQEFASEAQSNAEFRAMLKSIKLEKGPLKTVWDGFVDIVRKMFGATPRGQETALDRIDRLMDDLLSAAKIEPKTPGDILLMDANVSGASAAYKQILEEMGSRSRALPEMTTSWVDATGKLGRAAVKLIAKTLDLNHIAEIYGNRVPAIKGMINQLEERAGYTKTQIDKAARIARHVKDVFSKYEGKPQLERFADVVYDSTQHRHDPSDPKNSGNPTSPKGASIQQMYDNLPKDLRETYVMLKNHYSEIYKDYIAALEKDLAILPPEEVALIKKEIESKIKPYFPLSRFGDFWLQFERGGSRVVMAFETPEERERFIAAEKLDTKDKGFKRYKNLEEVVAGRLPPTDPIIQRTLKALRDNNVDKAVVDDVYRTLLKMHPQQSAIMNMIKRENIPGFSRDVLRSYVETVPKLISQTASRMYNKNIEFMAGLARTQLAEISNANPKGYDALADEVAEQLSGAENSRLQAVINPKFSTLAQSLNWMTYTYFLGANVSTALINMTQTPMIAYPLMGSEFGYGKAASQLMSAYREYGRLAYKNIGSDVSKYGYLSPLHAIGKDHPLRALYDQLQKRGQITFSLQQELHDMNTKPTALQGKAARAANLAITFAHQHSEMANREVTAIAAYNLAMEKFNDKQKAIDYAIDVVKKSHGSGMSETAGPIFQHPVGRTVLIFKRFAQLMLFRTARLTYQSIMGNPHLSPVEREQAKSLARKQLFGIAVMSFAFAGAQGMPFYGLIELMHDIFQAAFGDDDEYTDFKNWARNTLGEFAFKGPFVYATGADISSRTGFSDLLIRDDSKSKAELGALRYYFEQFFLGAPFSILTGLSRGAEQIGQGHWERGLETMAPLAVRNAMKGTRFWLEGAKTLKGDSITDDLSAMDALFQLGGFAPAKLTEIYDKRGFMKEMDIFIRNRKRSLLDQYELAKDSGDYDALGDVQEKISKFNQAYPETRITSDTIRSSMRKRDQQEKAAVYGVQIDKRVRERIRRAAEGED